MKQNVLNTDLTGKVAVVTGAGGVLCSDMAKVLARAGAKEALLNRTVSKAQVYADEIVAEGGIARAYQCNVLVESDCKVTAQQVLEDLGPCDILVNGAGGNSAKANTDKEFYEAGDVDNSLLQTFFTISPENVSSVLDLNFLGTLIPTQVFARQMLGPPGLQYHQSVQHERLYPADQDPGLLRRKGGGIQLYTVAGGAFQQGGHPGQRHCSRLLCIGAERAAAVQ